MKIESCHIINLPKNTDHRGNLTFIEGGNHIPFDIKRVYYLYDVPVTKKRGIHPISMKYFQGECPIINIKPSSEKIYDALVKVISKSSKDFLIKKRVVTKWAFLNQDVLAISNQFATFYNACSGYE